MRLILLSFITLFLVGCGEVKVSELTKSECIKKGHKWSSSKKMNWLSGKEEDKGSCKERK